jgi:hypothetical protein
MKDSFIHRGVWSAQEKLDERPRNSPGSRNRAKKYGKTLDEIPVFRWDALGVFNTLWRMFNTSASRSLRLNPNLRGVLSIACG